MPIRRCAYQKYMSLSILNWNYLIKKVKFNPDMRTQFIAAIKEFLFQLRNIYYVCVLILCFSVNSVKKH